MVAFKAELQNTNWGEVGEHNDPNFAYETFLDKYIAAYNKCFPLKTFKAKNCSLSKPWLSKGLLKSIRKKNILYKQFQCKPSPHREKRYKEYRNKLTCYLRNAKRMCYEKKLEECKSNMK